jgi:hypothetical protein
VLENLEPAKKVEVPKELRAAFEFDGNEGFAQLPPSEGVPSFDDFLIEQGFDPAEFEVIGVPRTSRWQRYDGEWLSSYRFHFRRKTTDLDLPTLYATAKKAVKKKGKPLQVKTTNKALVILWSDLQVGKVDHRGGTEALIERVELTKQRLIKLIKEHKPAKVIFADLGDTVEGFDNAGGNQLQSNDLSPMQQVDLATTLAWDHLKTLAEYVPEIIYASVGSNHCQWRVRGKQQGTATDDWGIHIGRTLARLANEVGLPIKFIEPQPHDESLALDVFDDQFHILGVWHGHQSPRPDQVPTWWRQQAFGRQPVADATIGVSGHFHHLRVLELGSTSRGASRFWIQASTMDNGSGWWRLRSGEDSVPGLVTFILEQGVDFTGTVYKL